MSKTTAAPQSVKALLPWLVAIAFFLESMDTTVLNTAVPVISRALAVTPLSMKSVLSSYTLSLAIFIPVSGWMADRFGTRTVFGSAIGVFTAASFLSGLSHDINGLIVCRVLQGCGGAMMVPVGRLTLVRTLEKSELVKAMSFVAIPSLIGPMIGPLIGGSIVAYLNWRFIFFINIPVGLIGMILVFRLLPNYRELKVGPLDLIGLVLFGSGVGLLSYVLEIFGQHRLGGVVDTALLIGAVGLIIGYGVYAVRAEYPLLDLSIFKVRTFRGAVAGGFLTRLSVGGIPFLLPLLYQVGLGLTPIQSGLLIMPQAIAAMTTKFMLPHVLDRLGYRNVLIGNTLLVAAALFAFTFVGPATPIWLIVALALVYGGLTSLQYTSMNTLVYADIEPERMSHASALASTLQQLSVSFGVAGAGLTAVVFLAAPNGGPATLVAGIHNAFLFLGGLTVVTAFVFTWLKADDGSSEIRHADLHHN